MKPSGETTARTQHVLTAVHEDRPREPAGASLTPHCRQAAPSTDCSCSSNKRLEKEKGERNQTDVHVKTQVRRVPGGDGELHSRGRRTHLSRIRRHLLSAYCTRGICQLRTIRALSPFRPPSEGETNLSPFTQERGKGLREVGETTKVTSASDSRAMILRTRIFCLQVFSARLCRELRRKSYCSYYYYPESSLLSFSLFQSSNNHLNFIYFPFY